MKFLHEPLAKAGKHVVEELRRNGGVGGLISLDGKGHGMYLRLCRE
jgi:L-asparaginase / beta-aspartyl-peptidase